MPNPHIFSNGGMPLKAMQEALVAAMAVKKLGEAFGLETNDIFLPLPEGMATQLGLAEGTVLQATRMRMDNSGEVILEGTLVGKNLESEKNFILVGSASDMAASLGQGNDTKGAQLLLIQEKDGFRAVTYVPDGNEKGNIRILSEGTGLNPTTVRAVLNKSELVGGLGAKPGILERAAESAIEGTKNAIKAIPGAETIMKMGTDGKGEKATPTEKPALPKVPESLFEQLAPMFTPGAPTFPGMGPLKVQTNLVETLFANASEILGKWDFTFMSAPNEEPAADKAPIVVASANVQPVDSPLTPTAVKPTASVAPASVVESDVAATVKSAALIDTKSLKTTATAETLEKKGFFARVTEAVSSYKEDLKTVVGFVKDETVAFCQDTVGAMVDTKEKVVDVAQKVGDKAEDVKLKVWNFEYGLTQGLTGDSPVSLMYDGQKGDWFRNDTADSLYKGNEGLRNTGYEVGDFAHDRGLDFMDILKVNLSIGPGLKGEIALPDFKVVAGGSVGNKYGIDGRNVIGEAYGRGEVGIQAGPYQIKPSVSFIKDLIGQGGERTEFSWGIKLGEWIMGKIGNVDIKGSVAIKENLTPEIGISGQGGFVGGELKARPFEALDFISGFVGLDISNDDEPNPRFGAPQSYRTFLLTETGQPYLNSQIAPTAKQGEVPGFFVKFVSFSTNVSQDTGKAVSDLSGASASILNAGWQWTKNISLNTTANIYTSVIHYGEDVSTIVGATVGAVKDIGIYSADMVRDGGNWSKEKASIVAEPFARNVSASFNEMTRTDPVTANKVAIGMVASIFSGDIWDRSMPIVFDRHGPAVVTVNGVFTSEISGRTMNRFINTSLGILTSVAIVNNSHGPYVGDILQVAAHEYLGVIDTPAVHTAAALRQGIREKDEVYLIAHSQGTAISHAALKLLTPDERSKVHYLGLGSETYVSENGIGLADAKNVRNEGDLVPILGNNVRVSNWLAPSEWSRKVGKAWTQINQNGDGNRHSFKEFYRQEVDIWAKERRLK